MSEYDYASLRKLRDLYANVRNHDEERVVANSLIAYLTESDSEHFYQDFKIHNYGGEPAELLPLHPGIEERVGFLDGLLSKLEKPLAMYSTEELQFKYFNLFKSRQIEILGKEIKGETIDNLIFAANELDIRHAQTGTYSDALRDIVPEDVQRTILIEGIKIMETDNYRADNIVFGAVCSNVRSLFKEHGLTKKRKNA